MNKKVQVILLILVFFFAFFLRFYKLGEIPNGLYQDESAIGYNAYSILETGRDEHGKFMPLYFKSFGDWKLPVYIYVAVVPIKILGLNEFAVRFPSAFFGSLSIIFFYFIVKQISGNRKIATISSLLLAINPWHIQFSRSGFEVNVALFFSLLGIWAFLKSLNGSKILPFMILCIFSFVLSLYSYNVTRLLSPLILLVLIYYYRSNLRKIPAKYTVITLLLFGILLLPFLLTLFSLSGFNSARGALITSADIQVNFTEFRSYLINIPNIISSVFFNRWIMLFWQYLENLVSSFSTAFFFLTGSKHGNQGIGNVGTFYLFQFPLIIAGLILILKEKLKRYYFFLIFAIICFLVLGLSKEVPHATRGYFIVVPFQVFSALGLTYFWNLRRNIKRRLRLALIFFSSFIVFFNIIFYLTSYYFRFPVLYAKSWRSEDKTLSLYLKENEHKYSKIIFDNTAGFIYSSLLFYFPYPPSEFQTKAVRYPDDSEGFSHVKSFGKYEFKNVEWPSDYENNRDTLIVTSAERKPNDIPSIKTFYYPQRPVVFSIKEKIIQYPIQEVAYVLVETR
ncbi:MAG: glycosyltransferase family 39 protein [Candidatus Pacearchaeota archaeon]